MLKLLHTLKPEYKNKQIYIWNINRNSLVVLGMLTFSRVKVEGFVTNEKKYVGQSYLNHRIYDVDEISMQEHALIVLADEVPKREITFINNIVVKRYDEILAIDETLKNKKVMIYGHGKGAEQLEKELKEYHIDAESYIVTWKKEKQDYYNGKRVYTINDMKEMRDQDRVILISVTNMEYKREIIEVIQDINLTVYIRDFVWAYHLLTTSFMQTLHSAIERNKKVYIYGTNQKTKSLLEYMLCVFGADYEGCIYLVEIEEKNIQCVYDVILEGIEDKFVIINELSDIAIAQAVEVLIDTGFSIDDMNYTAIAPYAYKKDYFLKQNRSKLYPDPLAGWSMRNEDFYNSSWARFGRHDKEDVIIAVLGGSTSAEASYEVKTWVEKLYVKLRKKGYRVTVYNAARLGEDITMEMLRLLRDGYYLKPDIVISMSGVNNTSRKHAQNEFNSEAILERYRAMYQDKEICTGIPADDTPYEFWVRNVKLMKVISNFFGAEYHAFLQPMNIGMSYESVSEKANFENERTKVAGVEFHEKAHFEDGYINLKNLFEHQQGMYFDICHYTENATDVLSDKVIEYIMSDVVKISKLKERKE